jgi:hypothetical protein
VVSLISAAGNPGRMSGSPTAALSHRICRAAGGNGERLAGAPSDQFFDWGVSVSTSSEITVFSSIRTLLQLIVI